MHEAAAFALRALAVGAGATLLLDGWTLLLRRFGIRPADWALVGRWAGRLARGRLRPADISAAPPMRGERLLGWGVHYATGVAFAALLLALQGPGWPRAPGLPACVAFGVATVVFPFFVMQPGMGAGIAAARTPAPLRARARSLSTHAVFGLALFVAAHAAAAWLPSGR